MDVPRPPTSQPPPWARPAPYRRRVPARFRTARRYPPGRATDTWHQPGLRARVLSRGCEIVAQRGVDALTMRGLARDLGVSATALVYHFGNRAGMRQAVAEHAAERLKETALFREGTRRTPQRVRESIRLWSDLATRSPTLYRLICGEGWAEPAFPVPFRRDWMHRTRIALGGRPAAPAGYAARPLEASQVGSYMLFGGVHGLIHAAAHGSIPAALLTEAIDLWMCAVTSLVSEREEARGRGDGSVQGNPPERRRAREQSGSRGP